MMFIDGVRALLAFAALVPLVDACLCSGDGGLCSQFDQASAVIHVKVLSTTVRTTSEAQSNGNTVFGFKTLGAFKGQMNQVYAWPGGTFDITAWGGDRDPCGVNLIPGREYLIGLHDDNVNGDGGGGGDGDQLQSMHLCGMFREWETVTKDDWIAMKNGCRENGGGSDGGRSPGRGGGGGGVLAPRSLGATRVDPPTNVPLVPGDGRGGGGRGGRGNGGGGISPGGDRGSGGDGDHDTDGGGDFRSLRGLGHDPRRPPPPPPPYDNPDHGDDCGGKTCGDGQKCHRDKDGRYRCVPDGCDGMVCETGKKCRLDSTGDGTYRCLDRCDNACDANTNEECHVDDSGNYRCFADECDLGCDPGTKCRLDSTPEDVAYRCLDRCDNVCDESMGQKCRRVEDWDYRCVTGSGGCADCEEDEECYYVDIAEYIEDNRCLKEPHGSHDHGDTCVDDDTCPGGQACVVIPAYANKHFGAGQGEMVYVCVDQCDHAECNDLSAACLPQDCDTPACRWRDLEPVDRPVLCVNGDE